MDESRRQAQRHVQEEDRCSDCWLATRSNQEAVKVSLDGKLACDGRTHPQREHDEGQVATAERADQQVYRYGEQGARGYEELEVCSGFPFAVVGGVPDAHIQGCQGVPVDAQEEQCLFARGECYREQRFLAGDGAGGEWAGDAPGPRGFDAAAAGVEAVNIDIFQAGMPERQPARYRTARCVADA